jgi:chemotaxis response regulator CheB
MLRADVGESALDNGVAELVAGNVNCLILSGSEDDAATVAARLKAHSAANKSASGCLRRTCVK